MLAAPLMPRPMRPQGKPKESAGAGHLSRRLRREPTTICRMADRLLKFSPVNAACDVRASWHVYYGAYYAGIINPAGERWRGWLHGVMLGEFDMLDDGKEAVAEWYYRPSAEFP